MEKRPVGYLYERQGSDGNVYRNFSFTLEGAKSVANVGKIYALHSEDEPCFVVEEGEAK